MPASYSLFELNEYIRRIIALNFTESIWIHAEIAQIKEVKGNVYIDLIQHDSSSGDITAQMAANIWYKPYLFIKNKLGSLLPSILCQGSQVLLKVQVEFNERYGLKLIVEDVDPSYTIGQMEMNRTKILEQLKSQGWLDINKQIRLPKVFQKIAVISSENAAGYIDFINHMHSNAFGYQYKITLFQAAMQGQRTEKEVCQALEAIENNHQSFDCILIIRGGGSKMDLAWFDNYNIGITVGKSSIPVITGIGHDIDSTVTDIVAHTSLKTPTAVAAFIIDHNAAFEGDIINMMERMGHLIRRSVRQYEYRMTSLTKMLSSIPQEKVNNRNLLLQFKTQQLASAVQIQISKQKEKLQNTMANIALLQPHNVLKRGYAIVHQEGAVITRAAGFSQAKVTDIEFFDHKVQIKPNEK